MTIKLKIVNNEILLCNVTTKKLYFSVDLDWFTKIIPCGIIGKGVTSLTSELNQEIKIEEVRPVLVKHFGDQFSAQMEDCSPEDLEKYLPSELNLTLEPDS